MALNPGESVGRLVAARLARAPLFDRLGIDFCCHGETPLDVACRQGGLDVERVMAQIRACDAETTNPDEPDFSVMPLGELADHIEATHHAYLRQELPRLQGLLAKVREAHGERHPELRALGEVLAGLREEIDSHLVKEERVLFPIIKQLEAASALPRLHCGSVTNPIRVMEHEHVAVGEGLAQMRELTAGFVTPHDGCTSFALLMEGLAALEADLHRHIHKENNILFPRAAALEQTLPPAAS